MGVASFITVGNVPLEYQDHADAETLLVNAEANGHVRATVDVRVMTLEEFQALVPAVAKDARQVELDAKALLFKSRTASLADVQAYIVAKDAL